MVKYWRQGVSDFISLLLSNIIIIFFIPACLRAYNSQTVAYSGLHQLQKHSVLAQRLSMDAVIRCSIRSEVSLRL